jgi:AcrR family transcriptional regulator
MTQNAPKEDRRKQRTRKLLLQALMDLIVEKGYASISIQDITDRADVSRTTFYLHFRDKDELLAVGMREMYDEMVSTYTPLSRHEVQERGYYTSLLEPTDYRHVAKNADFYRAMLSEKGAPAFIVTVQNYLAQVLNEFCLKLAHDDYKPPVPLDFIAYALAGMEVGIIHWWLHHDQMQHSPEMLSVMEYYIASHGLWQVLGIDLPPIDFETLVNAVQPVTDK